MKYTVYVWEDDQYDLSRWIELIAESDQRCSLSMCAGEGQCVGPYSCSVEHLLFAAAGFTYQVASETGYCSITSEEAGLAFEYQSERTEPVQWCCVKKDEFLKALGNLGYAVPSQTSRGLLF